MYLCCAGVSSLQVKLFCHEICNQLDVQIVVFLFVTPCVNDLLMFQNILFVSSSGFPCTLKMNVANSSGTLIATQISVQCYKPKDHIKVFVAIKIPNPSSQVFNLLLKDRV